MKKRPGLAYFLKKNILDYFLTFVNQAAWSIEIVLCT